MKRRHTTNFTNFTNPKESVKFVKFVAHVQNLVSNIFSRNFQYCPTELMSIFSSGV